MGWRLFKTAADPFLASIGLGFALWMLCAVCVNVFGDRWNYVQINGYMWTFCAMVARGLDIERDEQDQSEAVDDDDAIVGLTDAMA